MKDSLLVLVLFLSYGSGCKNRSEAHGSYTKSDFVGESVIATGQTSDQSEVEVFFAEGTADENREKWLDSQTLYGITPRIPAIDEQAVMLRGNWTISFDYTVGEYGCNLQFMQQGRVGIWASEDHFRLSIRNGKVILVEHSIGQDGSENRRILEGTDLNTPAKKYGRLEIVRTGNLIDVSNDGIPVLYKVKADKYDGGWVKFETRSNACDSISNFRIAVRNKK